MLSESGLSLVEVDTECPWNWSLKVGNLGDFQSDIGTSKGFFPIYSSGNKVND